MEFANGATEDIYRGIGSNRSRKLLPVQLHGIARIKLDRIAHATGLDDLRTPPGNQLEALKGDRKGQYSVRINGQYRICFRWVDGEALDVEIVDYH
jgi:toxin HigB-1